MTPRRLASVALSCLLAFAFSGPVRASAAAPDPDDGWRFVSVDVGTFSLAQCGLGDFCVWSSNNYTGSFSAYSGQGVTQPLGIATGSFWNNRAKAARLYNNAGTASICYASRDMLANVGSNYNMASQVYLSATGTC